MAEGRPLPAAAVSRPPTRRRLVTTACLTAQFMAAVEATIVGTAMPTIIGDLGGFQLFSWVFAAYLLPQAVTTPIYGRLADLYGRKRVFFAGATLFVLSSAACGFAWGMVPLIAFRALQGFGAGAVQPVAWIIIGDIYSPAERARVQGLLSAVFGTSAIAGPLLGAFIVEHLHWALVFWINLPVGLAAILMLAWSFDEAVQLRRHRVDYIGAFLLMLGVGALMLIIVQMESLSAPAIWTFGILGGVALAGLAFYEQHVPEPIMPFKYWRNRVIATGNLGGFTLGVLMICNVAYLPTYVQGAMGRSPTVAGLMLGASSVAWTCGTILSGRLMIRTSYRTTAGIGGVIAIVGSLVLIGLTPTRGPLWAAVGAATLGLGLGFCNTTFVVSVQTIAGWSERGAVVSANMFMRTIGQSLGAGVFGAILTLGVARLVPDAGDSVNRLLEPDRRLSLAPDMIARLSQAIGAAMHDVYLLGGLLALVVLAFSLWIPAGLSPTRQASASTAAPARPVAGSADD